MDKQRTRLIRRELLNLQLQEQKLCQEAMRGKSVNWKAALEKKVPDKVYSGLQSAFRTGFALVFRQGRKLIEMTYRKEDLKSSHLQRNAAVQTQASRKDLKQMQKSAHQSDGWNLAATTAEGVALGILGVGLPDIVLFLTTLLKGIYETALHYGFEYESPQEQYLILKMMSASLKTGRAWIQENEAVDRLLEEEAIVVSTEVLQLQLEQTASVFAMDMLVLKLIQGMPVVGILGGAANPMYYHKVMKYVQRKYRKRYLLKQLKNH